MKKLFTLIVAAAVVSLTLNSCLSDDQDGHAEIGYVGLCDSIIYSDSANNLRFDPFLKQSIVETFQESAVSDDGSAYTAAYKCNEQAVNTWKNKVDQITISSLANKMFKENFDTLQKHMGIMTAADLVDNIKPITIKTKLYVSFIDGRTYVLSTLDKELK